MTVSEIREGRLMLQNIISARAVVKFGLVFGMVFQVVWLRWVKKCHTANSIGIVDEIKTVKNTAVFLIDCVTRPPHSGVIVLSTTWTVQALFIRVTLGLVGTIAHVNDASVSIPRTGLVEII